MQEQIKEIVTRFKESDWNSLFEYKQNPNRFYINFKDAALSNQQYQIWSVFEKMARQKFESLVTDGNRMHFCYEEIIIQYSAHIQQLKDELNHRKRMQEEERLESEKVVKELNEKIADLNRQIATKLQNYREIAEKYDELIQHANEVHMEESKQVKQLESQRMRQSMHFELEMEMSNKEIGETRSLLTEALENNETLLRQNNELKHKIERLIQANEYLKERLNPQTSRQHIRVENKEEQDLQSYGSIERGDVESLDKGSKFGVDEAKLNNSQQINFTDEKQLLEISQHYSKFNITQQLHRRGFSNDLDFNDNKSIVKKYMTNNEMIEKINDLFEKDTVKNCSLIDEEIECNLQSSHTICKAHAIDPYRAFFQLMVQCQKLNSPYFSRIAHIDISSFFDELIGGFVSYNLWQDEIRKKLHAKIRKR